MGLDAWVHYVPEDGLATDQETDVVLSEEGLEKGHLNFPCLKEELYYWRKNHSLHDWMGNLYNSKGGTDPMFNCNNVRITLEDLDELEKHVMCGNLDKDWEDEDVLFIIKAREKIQDGYALFYDSWW